ncbi:Rubredoxin-like domain-containing protein, partial [Dysosmobacter welbionis]
EDGRHGRGRHRGDRPGQSPQRFCEKDRSRHTGLRGGDRSGCGEPARHAGTTDKGEGMMNFAGKTAVVTGGSRGIGRAICEELARGGANVVLCY